MTAHIRAYTQSLTNKHYSDEWLQLYGQLRLLDKPDFERFKVLTIEYKQYYLSMIDTIIITYNNSWTLSPEYFWPNIIILNESSQVIEAVALLPVVQFLRSLKQAIFASNDQRL
jgi:hypothetical protein